MIRILQKDSRAVKILFAVIIGAAVVTMVITLVPGIFDNGGASDGSVFATVRDPGVLGRLTGDSIPPIKMTEVAQLAQRELQQQHYPDMLLPYMERQAGQMLVNTAILKHEADRMGLQVSDNDLRWDLRTGKFGPYLFPNGTYIGYDQYINFVQAAFQTSVSEFESLEKEDMEIKRLQAMITGGVTVSDNAVRDAYRVQGTKVKFDYAVLSSDDLRKQINPTDAELETYFKQNPGKYATAIPETRKIVYVAFDASALPGGKPQLSDADIEGYYNQHKDQFSVKEQVKTRHILITVPAGADSKTDAAAKAKAQDLLKQIKAGGNFADLAKKNSDDPGSKDKGGELPMIATSGLDPAYAKAAMALNPGQTSDLVRSQFGYHIIQTEAKDVAHAKPLPEVKGEIVPVLEQQKVGSVEQSFAQQLAAQAQKDGLEKMAAAHSLHAVTTDYVAKDGVIAGLAEASGLLAQAFTASKGAAPATASTGDGFAVFQVVDVKAAHAPSFAEYKSHVTEDYREQRVPELLNTQLKKLADRAKVLNDLKKAAAEMNVPLKTSDLVGKDGQVPDLGAMSGPAAVAFSLAKGAISGPVNTGRAGAVLSVVDKQEPTTDEIAKNFEQTREQLLSQQQQEVFQVYFGTLTDKYQKAGAIRYSQKQPTSPVGN